MSEQTRSHEACEGDASRLTQPYLPRGRDDVILPPQEPDVALFIHSCSISRVVKVPTLHFRCFYWVVLQRQQHPFGEGNEFRDDEPQPGAQIWVSILLLALTGTWVSFVISLSLFSLYPRTQRTLLVN